MKDLAVSRDQADRLLIALGEQAHGNIDDLTGATLNRERKSKINKANFFKDKRDPSSKFKNTSC